MGASEDRDEAEYLERLFAVAREAARRALRGRRLPPGTLTRDFLVDVAYEGVPEWRKIILDPTGRIHLTPDLAPLDEFRVFIRRKADRDRKNSWAEYFRNHPTIEQFRRLSQRVILTPTQELDARQERHASIRWLRDMAGRLEALIRVIATSEVEQSALRCLVKLAVRDRRVSQREVHRTTGLSVGKIKDLMPRFVAALEAEERLGGFGPCQLRSRLG